MVDSRHSDPGLAAALKRRLAPSLQTTPACLDAEALAAYVDGEMAPAEREACVGHLATCGICQAQLAAVVRTAGLGERADAGGAASAWRRLFGWRWIAPLATAAVATLAIWVATPVSLDEPAAPAEVDLTQAQQARAERPQAVVDGNDETDESNLTALLAERANTLETEASADGVRLEQQAAAAAPTRAVGPADAQAAAAPRPANAAPERAREIAVDRPEAESRVDAIAADQAFDRRALGAATIVVRSPDPSVQWRLVGTGVDRTDDAGVSWTRTLDVETELAAGAAPTDTVCWVVGGQGAVFRTTDGRTWEALRVAGAGDLTAVTSANALNATVRASGGASFTTSDGGRSWTPH